MLPSPPAQTAPAGVLVDDATVSATHALICASHFPSPGASLVFAVALAAAALPAKHSCFNTLTCAGCWVWHVIASP